MSSQILPYYFVEHIAHFCLHFWVYIHTKSLYIPTIYTSQLAIFFVLLRQLYRVVVESSGFLFLAACRIYSFNWLMEMSVLCRWATSTAILSSCHPFPLCFLYYLSVGKAPFQAYLEITCYEGLISLKSTHSGTLAVSTYNRVVRTLKGHLTFHHGCDAFSLVQEMVASPVQVLLLIVFFLAPSRFWSSNFFFQYLKKYFTKTA